MIRVLHITGCLCVGGTETFIMNVFREIRKKNIIFDFLLFNNSKEGYFEEAVSLGAKIYILPSRRDGVMAYRKALDIFFKVHHTEYNIVHYSGCTLSSIAPLFFAKKYGISCRIVHGHSSSWTGLHNYLLHSVNRIFISELATHFLACSESSYDCFYKGIVPRSITEIIRNGIDVDRFEYNIEVRQQYRKQYGIADDTLVFGHIGRFSDVKNHKQLINVFAEIVKVEPNARLLLVGEGETMPFVKAQANDLCVADKIIYVGQQTNVSPFLQAMDCIIMPSLYEGLPFALVEAQAAGLPFVASTGISKEVDIIGHAKFISLQAPLNEWVDETLTLVKAYKRFNTKDIIVGAGYSIKDTVRRMEQIYSGY